MDNANIATDSPERLRKLVAAMICIPAPYAQKANDFDVVTTYTRAFDAAQPEVAEDDITGGGQLVAAQTSLAPPAASSTGGGQLGAGPSGAEGTAASSSSRRKRSKVIGEPTLLPPFTWYFPFFLRW